MRLIRKAIFNIQFTTMAFSYDNIILSIHYNGITILIVFSFFPLHFFFFWGLLVGRESGFKTQIGAWHLVFQSLSTFPNFSVAQIVQHHWWSQYPFVMWTIQIVWCRPISVYLPCQEFNQHCFRTEALVQCI